MMGQQGISNHHGPLLATLVGSLVLFLSMQWIMTHEVTLIGFVHRRLLPKIIVL